MKLPVFVSELPGFLEVPVSGLLAEQGALWVPLVAASLLLDWEWHLQWHGGDGSAFLSSFSHDEVGTDFSEGQSHLSVIKNHSRLYTRARGAEQGRWRFRYQSEAWCLYSAEQAVVTLWRTAVHRKENTSLFPFNPHNYNPQGFSSKVPTAPFPYGSKSSLALLLYAAIKARCPMVDKDLKPTV